MRLVMLGSIGLTILGISPVLAVAPSPLPPQQSRPMSESMVQTGWVRNPPSCRGDFELLVEHLLEDLPGYANRANIRYGKLNHYVMISGIPEFEPLPLTFHPEKSNEPSSDPPADPKQVFFTTLVRRYEGRNPRQLQEYHWLFLTHTSSGWRFSMMYSRSGTYPQKKPPSPPRNSSEGTLAQAIRTWFRDCRHVSEQV